jgi:hypothetical protein
VNVGKTDLFRQLQIKSLKILLFLKRG